MTNRKSVPQGKSVPQDGKNDMAICQDGGTKKVTAALPMLLVGSRRPSADEVERDAQEFAPSTEISGRTSRNLIARHTKA